MEKRAREFLDMTGKYYSKNKVKWESLLNHIGLSFDEDVYNETILSVYEKIKNENEFDEKTDDEIIAYWYRSFINNIRRDKHYSRNNRTDDDVMELLKDEEYIVGNQHLYFTTMRMLFEMIREQYDGHSYHIFKMYYLMPDMTYDELSSIVGFDVKPKISRMRNWLRDNVKQDYC